jgi:hypothetical protein
MVRAKALPFESFTRTTAGQIAWVFLNQSLDHDEERAKAHIVNKEGRECVKEFDIERCPICHDPSEAISLNDLSPEIREEVYNPSEEAHISVYFPQNLDGKSAQQLEIEKYIEENKKSNKRTEE